MQPAADSRRSAIEVLWSELRGFWTSREAQPRPVHPWSLDHPLLRFAGGDTWTIRDACSGTQIFGDPGSGKTTGSGQSIARAMLNAGFGGLVLTVKSNETERWHRYMADAGRADDLIIFSPENSFRFNFMEYERSRGSRGGGRTTNLAELFVTALNCGEGAAASRARDPFWDNALRQLLRNTLDTLRLADEPITLEEMHHVITSAPQSTEESADDGWKRGSFLFDLLAKASERDLTPSDRADLNVTTRFWMQEFASVMDSRTRGNIVSTFTTLADGFMREELRELFCTGLNVTPEMTFEGKVILLDIPTKQFHDLGRIAQSLWKYCWMRSVEQSGRGPNDRPVFLWVDEAQNFLTPKEPEFLQTVREHKACCVYLTQARPNYMNALGASQQAAVDSTLALLRTKVFHCNGDPDTNEWAQRVISEDYRTRVNTSHSESEPTKPFELAKPRVTTNRSTERKPRILASAFGRLACGGPPSYCSEAIFFESGRDFRGGRGNFIGVSFPQSITP